MSFDCFENTFSHCKHRKGPLCCIGCASPPPSNADSEPSDGEMVEVLDVNSSGKVSANSIALDVVGASVDCGSSVVLFETSIGSGI